ncbi:bifunctional RNase H/acid phosphatase [Streptomyces sp.]|uniref:bifunctional RNase H/acid phosphatase n=1 Tax=Streptomyces sp. TaxID=1931 RepID=UPI002D415138|nr:bifunctional RNase H/acid phosphatase [Streptomyces sp.]HZF88743.1 bifunctional RNase H/acid phosphatase [Streptomyces sp.]
MREFIVEADGGSRGNPGPAGYGAVVIDAATGETLAEAAEFLGTVTNNVAEYRGLLAGLRAARDLDPTARVHVRMDSKLVVEQMSGRWKIKHPDMKPLAMEASRVLPPHQVTYEWIPRERNKHADRLANEAMDRGVAGTAPAARVATEPVTASAAPSAAEFAVEPGAVPAASAAEPAAASAAEAVGLPAEAAEPAAGSAAEAPRPAAAPAVEPPAAATPAAPPAEGPAKAEADLRAARTVATPTAAATSTPPVGWGSAPDLGAPATFVLLRHGETPLTPQKRFSGSGGSDPSLSAIGREQAERVAAALARRGTIQAIVSSPLARTRETAGIVAARLGLEVGIDDGLRETDFGAWEGLTFAEVHERHPEDLAAWLASPDAEPTGGGESFAATATRIAATRDKLVAAYAGRTVLLVTHVTPIKTLVRLALNAPAESLFRMELSAASLSVVAYYADGNASVRLLNDTAHLR